MPEKSNTPVPNYFTQNFATRPANYVEVLPESDTPKPPVFGLTTTQRTPGQGVISPTRSYIADRAARGRWNQARTKNAELQQQLYELGAYGENANQDKVVDGLIGKQTRAAIQKAQEMGYTYDQATGTLSKPAPKATESTTLEPRTRTIAQEQMASGVDKMKAGWQERSAGKFFSGLKEGMLGSLGNSKVGALISGAANVGYDNMYPYSYGDVVVNKATGETRPYEGGEVPAGFSLRQTTANDSVELQGASGFQKIKNAYKGKDPRRTHMELLANVDLNTPEGLKEWNTLVAQAPQGMVRIHGNPANDQFELRARLDQMNMYAGRPQQWDTYEVNPNYSSPTADARGSSTYRIKDETQRNRINGEMSNYFLSHSRNGHWNDAHTAYILPMMGYMGNQSLVADDEKGTNLRYGDWWDYTINGPQAHRFYTGDRLTEEGKAPVRTNYGRGHNSAEMSESTDALASAILGSAKEKMVTDFNNAVTENWNKVQSTGQKLIARGEGAVRDWANRNNTFRLNRPRV